MLKKCQTQIKLEFCNNHKKWEIFFLSIRRALDNNQPKQKTEYFVSTSSLPSIYIFFSRFLFRTEIIKSKKIKR